MCYLSGEKKSEIKLTGWLNYLQHKNDFGIESVRMM